MVVLVVVVVQVDDNGRHACSSLSLCVWFAWLADHQKKGQEEGGWCPVCVYGVVCVV